MQEKIVILDFGSQTTQLIGRRVRELSIYSEIIPYNKYPFGREKEEGIIGVILSGSPLSVYDKDAFRVDIAAINSAVPVLGICYGAQLMTYTMGGKVEPAPSREYGRANLSFIDEACPLFNGIEAGAQVWMSHGDTITEIPDGFKRVASTSDVHFAAFSVGDSMWGVQFHPEVYHSTCGMQLLENFAVGICGASRSWSAESFIESTVRELKEKLGNDRVILGLSGGVDSSVAAVLLNRAIGSNLTCIFVDHGMLRKNEFKEVLRDYECLGLNVIGVDASERFFADLAGVTDPEQKRKVIGRGFIDIFDRQAQKLTAMKWLAQGTIYPDVIESGAGDAAVIKSHHNVGGLPDYVDFKEIVEPLRMLFKDEVRQLGRELGLPEYLVSRQPFPGPGLAIRIIGNITKEKADTLRLADFIFREEMSKAGEDRNANQYFAVLTNTRSVGVMGDGRTYDYTLALRAVTTSDFMTADWARLPYELLDRVSTRIVNEVKGINRIVYDITSKPPATIEWE